MPDYHVNEAYAKNADEKGNPGLPSEAKKEEEKDFPEPATASEAFNIILEEVGSDGRFQWYLFFISAICGNFTALHNLGAGEWFSNFRSIE